MSIDSPFISTSMAEKVAMPAHAIRKGTSGEGESGRMAGAVAERFELAHPRFGAQHRGGDFGREWP